MYIGDFNDKKFQGRGIIISSINDSISFCPGAAYFVGRFKDGKKREKEFAIISMENQFILEDLLKTDL